jgi:hypothetical protein
VSCSVALSFKLIKDAKWRVLWLQGWSMNSNGKPKGRVCVCPSKDGGKTCFPMAISRVPLSESRTLTTQIQRKKDVGSTSDRLLEFQNVSEFHQLEMSHGIFA